LKIKIRRIEVGIPINIRKTLKFYMVSENSRGEERKEGGGNVVSDKSCHH
jgi:hypothetical protein